jgi:hypothetical protein
MIDGENKVVPDEDRAGNVILGPWPPREPPREPPMDPAIAQIRADIGQLRSAVAQLEQAIAQLTYDASLAAKQLREHTHPSMPPRGVTVIPMGGGS